MTKHTTSQPFVGVCGLQSSSDYTKLLELAARVLPGTGRFLMTGVKDSRTFIDPSVLTPDVQSFVHCDFTPDEPFERIVTRNLKRTIRYVRGLQLNVLPWMETDYKPLWRSLKQQHPDIKLMLQAHKAIMEQYAPEEIARRLSGLPVDYVLFDASQSRGIPYAHKTMGAYVAAARQYNPGKGIAVSGGLSGDI